jgi:hypothetical protein
MKIYASQVRKIKITPFGKLNDHAASIKVTSMKVPCIISIPCIIELLQYDLAKKRSGINVNSSDVD